MRGIAWRLRAYVDAAPCRGDVGDHGCDEAPPVGEP